MKKFSIFKFLIIFVLLISAHNVQASFLSVHVDKNEIKKGSLSNVSVILDTKGALINTVEGDLIYDKNILTIEQVNTGNSFISFWVEKPGVNSMGLVHFSGVVPGGISVSDGIVFSMLVRGNKEGQSSIGLADVNLLLNDGLGSNDLATINNSIINVTESTDGILEQVPKTDTTSPEKFIVVRTHDPAIFDNRWFVVFDTQDKGVGVDHYRVCELFGKYCENTTSPHVLKYQNPFYYINVSAYDKDGNSRDTLLMSNWLILIIVLLIFLLIYLGLRFSRRYLHKYKV